MLEHLRLLARIELLQKNITEDFDFLSDINILKSFDLPISTRLEDVHEGTLAYRLLDGRDIRPSTDLWDTLMTFSKSVYAEEPAHMAAEIYFEVLSDMPDIVFIPETNEELAKEDWQKIVVEPGKYPPRDDTSPDDAMPNITGGQSDVQGSTFLSAEGGDDEDCKKG